MTGRIHSFQSLGTVDGPGVRCVVFLQGCPLRCICCHNPDTWDSAGGEEVRLDVLVDKIMRFRTYFGQKGGVTVSGGEPLMQTPFVTALFRQLKNAGIHTALDTSGCVFDEETDELLRYTDLVLLDHKFATEEAYVRYTRGHLNQTEYFLDELNKRGIETWLRRVIIPGKSDSVESVRALNETAKRFSCVTRIELLPFRKLCTEKYDALGIPFPLADAPECAQKTIDTLSEWMDEQYRG